MSEQTIKGSLEDKVPATYERAVQILIEAHASGPDPIDIYDLPDPQRIVIRLIEVSEAFPEGGVDRRSADGGIEHIVPVFPMGPANDFPFRSEIVQVTPDEWAQLKRGDLRLNRDWGDLNSAHRVGDGY